MDRVNADWLAALIEMVIVRQRYSDAEEGGHEGPCFNRIHRLRGVRHRIRRRRRGVRR